MFKTVVAIILWCCHHEFAD